MDPNVSLPTEASKASAKTIAAAVNTVVESTPGTSKREAESVIKPLPPKVVIEIANLGLLEDGFGFLARDDGQRIYHILKKHTATREIYDALHFFRTACDNELKNTPSVASTDAPPAVPVNARQAGPMPVTAESVLTGYKMADKPVRLKKVMKWKDLAHMRQSRSIYLGKRHGDVFLTKVVQSNNVEEGIPQIASSVVLTDKELRVTDGAGAETIYAYGHPMTNAVLKVASAMTARGVDAANIDGQAKSPLCWVGETPGESYVPDDLKGARPAVQPNSPPPPAQAAQAAPAPTVSSAATPATPAKPTAPKAEPDFDQLNLLASEMGEPTGNGPIDEELAKDMPVVEPPPLVDAAALKNWHLPISDTPAATLVYAANRLNDGQILRIHEALKILAARDDGAVKADNIGFNADDSDKGNELAESASLTPMQAALGRMFVLYYGKNQLRDTMPGFKAEMKNGLPLQKELRHVVLGNPSAPVAPTAKINSAALAPAVGPAKVATAPSTGADLTRGIISPTKKGDKVRIDGKLQCIPSTHLDAIKAFIAQVGPGKVRVVKCHKTPDGLTRLDTIMVGTAEVNMQQEVATATKEAGVPELPLHAPTAAAVQTIKVALTAMTEPNPVVIAVSEPALPSQPMVPDLAAPAAPAPLDVGIPAGAPPSLDDGTCVPKLSESALVKLRPKAPSAFDI